MKHLGQPSFSQAEAECSQHSWQHQRHLWSSQGEEGQEGQVQTAIDWLMAWCFLQTKSSVCGIHIHGIFPWFFRNDFFRNEMWDIYIMYSLFLVAAYRVVASHWWTNFREGSKMPFWDVSQWPSRSFSNMVATWGFPCWRHGDEMISDDLGIWPGLVWTCFRWI